MNDWVVAGAGEEWECPRGHHLKGQPPQMGAWDVVGLLDSVAYCPQCLVEFVRKHAPAKRDTAPRRGKRG